MAPTIAVIGSGQLGSRHLQALAALEQPCNIVVVEPSANARQVARDRYLAVQSNERHRLVMLANTSTLPAELDLVIVATTADVRLCIIEDVLRRSKVRNWLLEKILFQRLEDYSIANRLLQDNPAVWVNLGQRLWPFFIELKERFADDPDLELQVIGSNWGLGCNAVHNVDIARFLWSGDLRHHADLDKELIDSKRATFKEFTGAISTMQGAKVRVRQISYAKGDSPFSFVVSHPTVQMIWRVNAGRLYESAANTNWRWSEREMIAPLQSVVTTRLAREMLQGSADCGLPRFADAVSVHLETIQALLAGAKRNGIYLGNVCPIT